MQGLPSRASDSRPERRARARRDQRTASRSSLRHVTGSFRWGGGVRKGAGRALDPGRRACDASCTRAESALLVGDFPWKEAMSQQSLPLLSPEPSTMQLTQPMPLRDASTHVAASPLQWPVSRNRTSATTNTSSSDDAASTTESITGPAETLDEILGFLKKCAAICGEEQQGGSLGSLLLPCLLWQWRNRRLLRLRQKEEAATTSALWPKPAWLRNPPCTNIRTGPIDQG